jgi:hypothetical protein
VIHFAAPVAGDWITGDCWKCDRTRLLVTWAGPARWSGQHAPIYLCEDCLVVMASRVRAYFLGCHPQSTQVFLTSRPQTARTPEKSAGQDRHDHPVVQMLSISIGGFGIRARANGSTGRDAWRLLRRRHPRLTVAVILYALLLAGVAVATVIRLVA